MMGGPQMAMGGMAPPEIGGQGIPQAPPPMMGFNGMMTAPEPPYQKTPKHPIVYAPLPGMKTTQLYLHE